MWFFLVLLVVCTPLALAAVHQIFVGGTNADGSPNLAYSPNNIVANVGDKVQFTFHVKNHTVTQSSFGSPCSKLLNSYGEPSGFDSGFMPVAANQTDLPTFEITVNDTAPIWGYCRQVSPPGPTHCQSGMAFAINAPLYGNTFDKFLAMAKAPASQNTLSSTVSESWGASTTVTVTETETITIDESASTSSVYWPDAPIPTPAAHPATHTIIVGGDPKTVGFRYTPPNITANVGDKVFFQFMVKNHTVTQSSFGDPCVPLADSATASYAYPPVQGFDSGFMPVAPNVTHFPNFTITVNDTQPIWGFCRQQAANFSHCGVGMVFSVNANPFSDKSFDIFQQLAVHKNGSGFVDPFGNLTAPPPSASGYSSSPSGYGSSESPAIFKNTEGLDALSSDTDPSSDSAKLNTLLNDYAPAALGLLATALVLLIALVVIGVLLLRRISSSTPSRSLTPTYRPVPINMPSSKLQEDGSHDYEELRYNDHRSSSV